MKGFYPCQSALLLAATAAALLVGCGEPDTRRLGGGGRGSNGGSLGVGSPTDGGTSDAGGTGAGGFSCEGPCVSGLDLSIPNGRPYAGGLPAATNTGAEPVITGTEWVREDDDTLILVVTAEPDVAFNQIYIEINAQVFIIESMESLIDIGQLDFCGLLESSQGIACTDSCIAACQCVLCADELVEHNARGTCTTTCSTWASNGLIGPGQTYESEVQLANLVYNGDPAIGLIGLVGQTECTAAVCADAAQRAAQRQSQRLTFEFHFDFADPIPDSIVVAQSGGGGGGDAPAISQPAGAASLRPDCCPAYGACAMRCQ
jgi:hypothetical protein